jgi:hypothetical protein
MEHGSLLAAPVTLRVNAWKHSPLLAQLAGKLAEGDNELIARENALALSRPDC